MHVNGKSRPSHKPNLSSGVETNATKGDELALGALTCEKPMPPSGGHVMPLAESRLEQLPAAILAYGVGDLLEFDERSDLGVASATTHAAMALGTSNPLYANLYEEHAACRKLAAGLELVGRALKLKAVRLAREDVEAERAGRSSRVAYADARKKWARTVQTTYAANPRNVMHITSVAKLLGELGRTDVAVQVLRWGLAQFPKDHFARLQLAQLLMQVRPPVGSMVLPDPTKEAITEARILEELNPKDPRPRVIIAKALLLQARDLIRKGDQAAGGHSAHAAALAELRREPAVNDPLILAMVEHSLGNETESAAAIKTYLDGRHGRPVDAQLAEVYAWRGELGLAHKCLEPILERNIHDNGLCQVAHSRFMDNMQGDSRWLPLLFRMNRAPDQLAAIRLEIQLPP